MCSKTSAQSIKWTTKNAIVWLPFKVVTGKLNLIKAKYVLLHHDYKILKTAVHNNKFYLDISLHDSINNVWVEATSENKKIYSDTLKLNVGYTLVPIVRPVAVVKQNNVWLLANLLANPQHTRLSYNWTADENNPTSVIINNCDKSIASVTIPSKPGKYYFKVTVCSGKDMASYKTYIIKTHDRVVAYDLKTSHAAWIDTSIIYEITPHHFTASSKYTDITKKLSELRELGINTIWLQPVYQTKNGGQGYDITDFFSLRTDFGNENDLKKLIDSAKALKMHVLFDFVINHVSINHPYAQDCLNNENSPYYYFFQHEKDGSLYSSHYINIKQRFIGYFWEDLVNLNYNNPEVQNWIIEACKYWINKFDIDGYRLDAMWAVNARYAQFATKLQQELKSIKPDLLLIAEDKGANTTLYKKGIDVAYDWTADTSYISHWSWQYDYDPEKNLTIFNHPDPNKRRNLLRNALFNNGDLTNKRLRFLENNDLPRFIQSHGLKKTKMAAALLFCLPGIPPNL